MDPGGGLFLDNGEYKIHFVLFEQLLKLQGIAFAQRQFQARKHFSDSVKNFGQMIAQDDGGSADANVPGLAALEIGGDFVEVCKEGLDELKELFTFGREREGPAVEEGGAEIFLKLSDLRADGGLLDAVGDVAYGGHDAAVAGDIIKKFEMMDVHRAGQCPAQFYQFMPPVQGELQGLHANAICNNINRTG